MPSTFLVAVTASWTGGRPEEAVLWPSFEVTSPLIGAFSQRERLRAGTAGTGRADPEDSGNASAWIPLFHPFIQSKAP